MLNFLIKDIPNHVSILKFDIFKLKSELEIWLPQDEIIDLLKYQIFLNGKLLNNDRKHEDNILSLNNQQTNVQEQNKNFSQHFLWRYRKSTYSGSMLNFCFGLSCSKRNRRNQKTQLTEFAPWVAYSFFFYRNWLRSILKIELNKFKGRKIIVNLQMLKKK